MDSQPQSQPPQQPAAPQPPPSQPAQPAQPVSISTKPAQMQFLAIGTLVSGIINCLAGFGLMFTVVWIAPAAFGIVVGILEILYATKMMSEPMKVNKPKRHIAIMEIICILNGSVTSLAMGIVALVFYNDPKVLAYFAAQPEPPK